MTRRGYTLLILAGVLIGLVIFMVRLRPAGERSLRVLQYLRNPEDHPDWEMQAGERCGDAPFIFPTDGLVGYLWGDNFKLGKQHQGIDIFAGTDVNRTPVLAVYPGFLTRLPEWKSTVIVRIPSDPLQPGRQIWVYYTHMADADGNSFISPDFPRGTQEVFIEAGTLLGNQGNYSGDPGNPNGVHLHLSIVLDDGLGSFRNELEIKNTLDPSPYLGLALNADGHSGAVILCSSTEEP